MVERTQSGTFVGGLVQGFQTGQQIQANRAQRKRQQKRFEAEQELNELKTEATKIELENAKSQQRRDEALRHLDTAVRAKESGNPDLASREFQAGVNELGMSVEDFSPEFAQAADTLERAFKQPDSVKQDEAVDAANRVFRNQVKKGVGKLDTPKRVNGQEVVEVTDKEITEIAPAPQDDGQGNQVEPGIMARMRVTGKTADGETVQWRAPLTANRSTDENDPAESVPIDDIAKQVIGRKKFIQGIASSPQFSDILRTARTRAGGEPKAVKRTVTGESLGLNGGLFQVDSETGEISEVVEPPETEAGFRVVTGDQLPNSNVQGGLFKVNRETGEPTELIAPGETAGGQTVSSENPRDLSAADESEIFSQAANLFGGRFDQQTGRVVGLDRDAQRNVQAIANRASQLFRTGEADTRSEAVTMAAGRLEPSIDIPGLQGSNQGAGGGQGAGGQPSGQGGGGLPGRGNRPGSPGSSQPGGQGGSSSGSSARGGQGQGDSSQSSDPRQVARQQIQQLGQDAVDRGGANPEVIQEIQRKAAETLERGADPAQVIDTVRSMIERHLRANRQQGITSEDTPRAQEGTGIVNPEAER